MSIDLKRVPETDARRAVAQTLAGVILAVAFIGLILIGWIIVREKAGENPAIMLPVLVIAGVIILLVALTLAAVSFSTFGLANASEALALPPGSVRAVIALSLVVIFAILTVFLYVNLSAANEGTLAVGLKQDDANKLVSQLTADQKTRVDIRKSTEATPAPSASPLPAGTNGSGAWDVFYRRDPTSASQDFAKQLLIMLGVLLSSVTGFYFGAKTAQAGINATAREGGSSKTPGGGSTTPGGGSTTLSTANLKLTPEAAQLGHDPSLASQPAPGTPGYGAY